MLAIGQRRRYSGAPEKMVMTSINETRRRSLEDPERFWGKVAEGIDWIKPWDRVLDDSNPPFFRWFAGGQLNTCYNALDRHVATRGNQAALIYDSAVTHTRRTYTYRRASKRSCTVRRRARCGRCDEGRPRSHLHADDPGSGDRNARLRPARRGALGRLRRLCSPGARDSHRRRATEGHRLRLLRHRGCPGRRVQAAARPGHRACEAQASDTASSGSGNL